MNTTQNFAQPDEDLFPIPGIGHYILVSQITMITKKPKEYRDLFYVSIEVSGQSIFIDNLSNEYATEIVNSLMEERKRVREEG